MLLRIALLSILLALIAGPSLAQNLVTYDYAGPDFTTIFSGTRFSTADSITGTLTINCDAIPGTADCVSLPLADHTAAVASFSFTATGSPDLTITSAGFNLGRLFSFQTDADGAIFGTYNMSFATSNGTGGELRITLRETFGNVNAAPGSPSGEGIAGATAGRWGQFETIVEYGAGLTGSGIAGGIGQSITTPVGFGWDRLEFNFYSSATGAPQAEGSVYLLDAPYGGTPQDLSTSTPGLVGVGVANGAGTSYEFPPALTLAPDTQYFVYADSRPNGPGGTTTTSDLYAGGSYFNSANGVGAFFPVLSIDAAFGLRGVTAPPVVIDSGGALGTTLTPGPVDLDGDGVSDVDFVSFGVDSGFLDASPPYGLTGNIGGPPGFGDAWARRNSLLVTIDGVGRNEIITAFRGAILASDDNWSKVHLSSGDGWVQWRFGATSDQVTPLVFVREGTQDLSASQAAFLALGPVVPAYLRSTVGAPWGASSNELAMDTAFGTGGWADERYETVDPAVLFAAAGFIFMEGSDGNADEMEAFIGTHLSEINAFLNAGGVIFFNSAPNEGDGMALPDGVGQSILLNYPGFSSDSASTTLPGHPIFIGPWPTSTSFTGSSFSHATISGAGLTSLLDGSSGVVLAERFVGAGLAIYGGMTVTDFQAPDPDADNLRANIIAYGDAIAIPEPSSSAGLCAGIAALSLCAAHRRRRRSKAA